MAAEFWEGQESNEFSRGNKLKEIPTFFIFIQFGMLFLVILNITCL